jgi:hypothetical protein
MPRVTIGVPVYNGALYLRESLECLRTQSFGDFVVVVSDNASSDATPDICAEYAARDPRFLHRRRETTAPAVENFLGLCDGAATELFMWRAYDDLSDPDYLARLVALLDRRPDAALAVGSVRVAHLHRPERDATFRPPAPAGGALGLRRRLFGSHAGWFYGLWRTAAVRAVFHEIDARFPHAWAQDHLILLPFLLDDAVAADPAAVFVQRLVGDRTKPPRPRPTLAQRAAMRRAFAQTVAAEIARRRWTPAERLALAALAPLYVDSRCHSLWSLLKARLRESAIRRE